jgi:predicted RNA binding protein YcfA (HicA-like mRNA interferase family)
MNQWSSTRARRVLAALLRIGWIVKRQSGSHRTLSRPGWPDFVFAFHDNEELGPRMLARIAKRTGLSRVLPTVVAYFLMGRFISSELRGMYAHALSRVSPSTLVARLRAIANVDVRTMFNRVAVPGLYLRATEDRLVSSSDARMFERLAPNARVVDIVAPHFLLQANSAAAAGAIKEFMREVA